MLGIGLIRRETGWSKSRKDRMVAAANSDSWNRGAHWSGHAHPLLANRFSATGIPGELMRPSAFNEAGIAATIRILQFSERLRQHRILGYAIAFIAIGSACRLRWQFATGYGGAPFLTIYPAVIFTTLLGGLGPGFLSAVLAGFSQWGFCIIHLHWFAALTYAFDATLAVLLIVFINRTLDLLVAGIDLEKQGKQHQYLLATELHHRIQNLFTVIQASACRATARSRNPSLRNV